jgi:arabinose-5-phosphate isomerase
MAEADMPHDFVAIAREVFEIEGAAIRALGDRLDANFERAVARVLQATGRLVVCGMGKSGIVGHKISATLASTGTPSFVLHPGEAYHGDLGMLRGEDVVLAISNSGETEEIVRLIPFFRDNGNAIIAMTGKVGSTLAMAADFHLDVAVNKEACPNQLAPTSSTTAALVMGDALAVALITARSFQPENFARFHPGGSLGRKLLSRVDDIMEKAPLPCLVKAAPFSEVLSIMTEGRLGLVIVKDVAEGAIITDGDLRRSIERFGPEVFHKCAGDMMTLNPRSIESGTRTSDAIELMEEQSITALLVRRCGELIGVLKK